MSEYYQEKKTYIALVLDKSGSMDTCRDEIISGYNEQLQTIKKDSKLGGETLISLFTFNDSVSEEFTNRDPEGVIELTKENYRPNGLTAMYDGVGRCLDYLAKFDSEGDVGFWVIVVSDGHENASKKYGQSYIAEKVKELQKTKRWTFSYIGANQDLTKIREMGLNTTAYSSTKQGSKAAFDTLKTSSSTFLGARSMGQTYCVDLMPESISEAQN